MISGRAIVQDAATPSLASIASRVRRRRGLHAAVGKRVEGAYRAKFLARDRAGNAKGWPRSHFWNRIRGAIALTHVDDAGAVVTISSLEYLHILRGGVVTPKRGKFLAIPVTARAKAACAGVINGDKQRKPARRGRGLFVIRPSGWRERGGWRRGALRDTRRHAKGC